MDKHDEIKRFKEAARTFLEQNLQDAGIKFITSQELIDITEEDAEEFMAQDQKNGLFKPLRYSKNVFRNFENNQNYYFDKINRSNK